MRSIKMCGQDLYSRRRFLYAIVVAVLLFLAYRPFLPVGFTDHDSMYLAIRWWHDDFHSWTVELARKQGRFTHQFVSYVQTLPFLIRDPIYYNLVKTSLNMGALIAFYWALRSCTGRRSFASLGALVYISVLVHPSNHSLLTGYIGYFQLAFISLLLSLISLDKYNRGQGWAWLIASIALFSLTLGAEDSPLYLIFHLLLTICRALERDERRPLRFAMIRIAPHILVTLLYVGVFVAYRAYYPSDYAGNLVNWSEFSIGDYFKTLFTYTIHLFPGVLMFGDKEYLALMQHYFVGDDAVNTPWEILLASMRFESILKATIIFGLVILIGPKAKIGGKRDLFFLSACALVLLVLPNAALSISPHYQDVALNGRRVLTHRSFTAGFGLALLFTVFFAFIFSCSRNKMGKHGTRIVCILTGLLFSIASVVTDCTNFYVLRSHQLSTMKWTALEEFFSSKQFMDLPDNSTLHAPALWKQPRTVYYNMNNFSGAHLVPLKQGEPNYWEKLCYVVSSKRVRIIKDSIQIHHEEGNDLTNIYLLHLGEAEGEDGPSVVLERVTEIDPYANRLLEPNNFSNWTGGAAFEVSSENERESQIISLGPGGNLYHAIRWNLRPGAQLEGSIQVWSETPCTISVTIERHSDTPFEGSKREWFDISPDPTRIKVVHAFAHHHEMVRLRLWAPADVPARFHARDASLRLLPTGEGH